MNELQHIETASLKLARMQRNKTLLGRLKRVIYGIKKDYQHKRTVKAHDKQIQRLLEGLKQQTKQLNNQNKYN